MMRRLLAATLVALALFPGQRSQACTNIIVGRKASADGSVMCSYNCDTFGYSGWLTHSLDPGVHIVTKSSGHAQFTSEMAPEETIEWFI